MDSNCQTRAHHDSNLGLSRQSVLTRPQGAASDTRGTMRGLPDWRGDVHTRRRSHRPAARRRGASHRLSDHGRQEPPPGARSARTRGGARLSPSGAVRTKAALAPRTHPHPAGALRSWSAARAPPYLALLWALRSRPAGALGLPWAPEHDPPCRTARLWSRVGRTLSPSLHPGRGGRRGERNPRDPSAANGI